MLNHVPFAELTGTAGTAFAIGFALVVGLVGGTVIAVRVRKTRAPAIDTRAGTTLLVSVIGFTFVLFLFLIEPVPWWVVLIAGASLVWAGTVELMKRRWRSKS
jgi:hypothetical protein